jgi:tyrosinase
MATQRPNQRDLKDSDWNNFINAINSMHGIGTAPPAYRDFVRLHADAMSPVGMSWRVHTMFPGMIGVNFLAWHRQFIYAFEKRLGLPLPYWSWIEDPDIPRRLNNPRLLSDWGITREFDRNHMPTHDQLDSEIRRKRFYVFQSVLESGVHNSVHNAVGGTMGTASSPADPLFFLHHANIDRIWSEWQVKNPRSNPTNKNETLQRPPIEGVKVSSVLSIKSMGYSYLT